MNSRIVKPAPSFQPPETRTEHGKCQSAQASSADLCRAAQAHYDKVSTAAHEWHSAIPKAIEAYYAEPERARLEREVIEAAKRCRQNDLAITGYWERRASDTGYDPDSAALFTLINSSGGKAFNAAVDALIDFESQHVIQK